MSSNNNLSKHASTLDAGKGKTVSPNKNALLLGSEKNATSQINITNVAKDSSSG
jgi:hypothetical protein